VRTMKVVMECQVMWRIDGSGGKDDNII